MEEFWICQRCGNRNEGLPTNQTLICMPCIERAVQGIPSIAGLWFRKIAIICAMIFLVYAPLVTLSVWLFPRPDGELKWWDWVLSVGLIGSTIIWGALERCPICRGYSRDAYRCMACNVQYRLEN